MKNKRKIIIIILAILLLFIGTSAYLAFWHKAPDAAQNQPSNLVDEIRTLEVNGGTLELTEDKINAAFKTLLAKPVSKNGIVIKGASVDIGEKAITLFVPVKYKGMNLLPNITGTIEYKNDRLIFIVTSFKVGKLSLPRFLLFNKLKKYSNADIVISQDKIEISKYLLPFNAENIYLSNNRIYAEIAKSALSQNSASNNQSSGKNSNAPSSNNSTTNGSTKTGSNQANKNSPSSSNNTSRVTLPATQISSLNRVSSQMGGAIAAVQTAKEKQMMRTIQTVVKNVAANPNYPYQSQANEVKAWYRNLKPDEKSRVKDAILNNVNVIEILKLINIFGV